MWSALGVVLAAVGLMGLFLYFWLFRSRRSGGEREAGSEASPEQLNEKLARGHHAGGARWDV